MACCAAVERMWVLALMLALFHAADGFLVPTLRAKATGLAPLSMVSAGKAESSWWRPDLLFGSGGFGKSVFVAPVVEDPIEKYVTKKEVYASWPLSMATSEDLIGEEMVTDDASASRLADQCIAEALRLFDSPTGWSKALEEDDIYVEHKDIHGAYAKSGVKVVRGIGTLDCSADDFFNFQISREGFQCIDEYLENHRKVADFKWETQPDYAPEDYELMVNRVEWKYPYKTREFVALDIVDRKRRILISKSALHPGRPGGSRYQYEVEKDEEEFVRAVQYYAAIAEDIPGGRMLLKMVTWGEMCDDYSAWWINKFNALLFITPKFQRFRRAMAGEKIFELNNIVTQAWKLPALLHVSPDHAGAKSADFVKKVTEAKK